MARCPPKGVFTVTHRSYRPPLSFQGGYNSTRSAAVIARGPPRRPGIESGAHPRSPGVQRGWGVTCSEYRHRVERDLARPAGRKGRYRWLIMRLQAMIPHLSSPCLAACRWEGSGGATPVMPGHPPKGGGPVTA